MNTISTFFFSRTELKRILIIVLFFFPVSYLTAQPYKAASWTEYNSATQTFPMTGAISAPFVTSATHDFSGLNRNNDGRTVWVNPNSSPEVDVATAPYLSYIITTNTDTSFDRFVMHGLALPNQSKLQLRWSVDNFSSSLGDLISDGGNYTLASVKLDEKGSVPAGTIEFRVYCYGSNGGWDYIFNPGGEAFSSIDGTPSSYLDVNSNVSLWYVAPAPPAPPASKNGLSFDGVDDHVSVGSPLQHYSSYTKEAWVYVTKNIFTPTNILSSNRSPFWIDGGNLKAGNNGPSAEVVDPTHFPANAWVHVAVSFDALTNTLRLYRDGILVSSAYSNYSYAEENNFIGAWFNGSSAESFMGGKMDEVRIWNVARSSEEIAADMYTSTPDIATTNGLVAVYGLNEGIGNVTANNSISPDKALNVDGTLVNGPSWSEPSPENNALHFDGTDDRVTIPNTTAFDFTTGTVECWVKPDILNGNACILGSRNQGQARFSFHMSTYAIGLWNGNSFSTVGFSSTPGTWYHLAFVCTPSATSVYVNGNFIGNTGDVIGDATNLPFNIGISDDNNFEAFSGAIDEVRIWNTERTQQMIQENMYVRFNNTTSPDLIALFDFNQGIAGGDNERLVTAIDIRNGHNGTLYNFSLNGNTSNWVGKVTSTSSPSVPVITSFFPATGTVGSHVTINGQGFDTTPENNIVYFGATRATVIASNSTSLTAIVPYGATYKPISVTNKASSLTGYSATSFTTIFQGGNLSFLPKAHTTGDDNRGVAFGDIDGDGLSDMIVTNSGNGTVTVFRNNGTPRAAYSQGDEFSVGSNPRSLAVGDMNGDGKLDIVTGNYMGSNFLVLLNVSMPGMISFEPAYTHNGNMSNPRGVAVGDVDGDGKTDIAVTHSSNTVSVFRNTGSGGMISFEENSVHTPDSYATGVAISDMDGDAKPDLAVINYNQNSVSIFSNRSSAGYISFQPSSEFSIGFYPWSITVADIDGDGRNDIAAPGQNAVSILTNRSEYGQLSFEPAVDFSLGSNRANAIAIGDLNGDGRADVAVANGDEDGEYAGLVSVFTNNGTSGVLALSSKTDFPVMAGPMDLAIGDVDNDGKPEMAIGHLMNPIALLYNTTAPASIQPPVVTSFFPASGPVGTTVVISGDGFSEIPDNNIVYFGATRATVTASTTNSITVIAPTTSTYQVISVTNIEHALTGYSAKPFNITFTPGVTAFSTKADLVNAEGPLAVAYGDLDGDGKTDMVVASAVRPMISVFRNKGNISNNPTYERTDYAPDNFVNSIAIGDIDGDGKPDIAVTIADYYNPHVNVFQNNSSTGSISFGPAISFVTDVDPNHIAIGDLDGDGKPELVTANTSNSSVSTLKNSSENDAISFDYHIDHSLPVSPSNVVIADFNGDNKPELVLNNTASNFLSVLTNTSLIGSISFDRPANYMVNGPRAGTLAVGDLDSDGKMDLAALNDNGKISIFQNTSENGEFLMFRNTDVDASPMASDLAIGDVDGDGQPDLTTIDYFDLKASVLKNVSVPNVFSFNPRIEFSTGIGFQRTSLADMNGDGKLDITLFDASNTTVSLLRNTTSASPLPITLTSFSAFKKVEKVVLNWSTASESNSARFEVEKSSNGRAFARIATVAAAGESVQKLDYTEEDKSPASGINYYRLKLVDRDGSFKYSSVVSASWTKDVAATVTLAPQPMENTATITISGEAEKSRFVIYDVSGKAVKTVAVTGNSSLQINKSGLVSGIYIYKLLSDKGVVLTTGKMVVQ